MHCHLLPKPRIVPLLLLNGQRLVKGIRFRRHRYVGDPMNVVRVFTEKRVDEMYLLEISATERGKIPDPEFVQRVADESYVPFGVGGGIRNTSEMRTLLRAGAEKVSINTAAVERPDLIREGSLEFGCQSITVSIDVKRDWRGRYRVWTHAGARRTDLDPVEWAMRAADLGAGEILLTSIHKDGTGEGYDLPLLRSVASAVPVPVIAAGGAGSPEDLVRAVCEGGASAAAAGALFVFYGPHRGVLIQYPRDLPWPPIESAPPSARGVAAAAVTPEP